MYGRRVIQDFWRCLFFCFLFFVVVVVCCAYATSLYQIRLSPWEIKPEVGQNIALSASVQFSSVQSLDRLDRRGDMRDD